ncbi:MAG: energy transducer TonB [Croceibacterium sp.]
MSQPLTSITFRPPHPPPPPLPTPPPPHHAAHKAKEKAAPQNIKKQATAIVAPPVIQPLIPPPPVVVATQAGVGAASNTGASAGRGPGQGVGGAGNGLGGGGGGDSGDGDEDAVVGPRQIRGKLAYEDLPLGVLALGQKASVQVRFTVNVDGSTSNCHAVRPSGVATVDELVCRLIMQRFTYRPARDADGRPVRVEVMEWHTWVENGRN